MGNELLRLGLGFLLGLALGLGLSLTELFRPMLSKPLSALSDGLYALLAGTAAFLYAISAPKGVMGTWELAAILLGLLTWVRSGAGDKTENALRRLLGKAFRLLSAKGKRSDEDGRDSL